MNFNKIKIAAVALLSLIAINSFSACAQEMPKAPTYVNPVGDKFPIMSWHAFNEENQVTDAFYKDFVKAGFNIAYSGSRDDNQIQKMIDLAHKHGIKQMLNCASYVNNNTLKKQLDKYKNHPAFAGINIFDEPIVSQFDMLAKPNKMLLKENPTSLSYCNLLPTYVTPEQLGAKSYTDYLETYIRTLNPQLIAFDNYGIIKKGSKIVCRDDYFENLEIASEVSKRAGIPMWTYILSTAHFSYPTATEGHISFQAFSGLAYGAQGIQYYGYAMSKSLAENGYHDSPVGLDGKKSKVWKRCKKVNEKIQALAPHFLGNDVKEVWHTGTTIPKHTKRIEGSKLPSEIKAVESKGIGVIVSYFTNNGKNYLMIVNRDFENNQEVKINKSNNVYRIKTSGRRVLDKSNKITLTPGGMALYQW